MGSYYELYVGNCKKDTGKNEVPEALMSLFQESDKRTFLRFFSVLKARGWGRGAGADQETYDPAFVYQSTVAEVIDRLEIQV